MKKIVFFFICFLFSCQFEESHRDFVNQMIDENYKRNNLKDEAPQNENQEKLDKMLYGPIFLYERAYEIQKLDKIIHDIESRREEINEKERKIENREDK